MVLLLVTFFKEVLVEGTVTAKVFSSRKQKEKRDRIGESQPLREEYLSL
jgi:hypothetical protein